MAIQPPFKVAFSAAKEYAKTKNAAACKEQLMRCLGFLYDTLTISRTTTDRAKCMTTIDSFKRIIHVLNTEGITPEVRKFFNIVVETTPPRYSSRPAPTPTPSAPSAPASASPAPVKAEPTPAPSAPASSGAGTDMGSLFDMLTPDTPTPSAPSAPSSPAGASAMGGGSIFDMLTPDTPTPAPVQPTAPTPATPPPAQPQEKPRAPISVAPSTPRAPERAIPPITPSPDKEWSEIVYDNSIGGVVTLHVPGGAGTGFIISDKGFLLTNHHVVVEDKYENTFHDEIYMCFSESKRLYKVNFIDADEDRDVALCRFDPSYLDSFSVLPIIDDYSRLRPGAAVVLIGNPVSQGIAPFTGTVSYTCNNSNDLVFSAPSNPGCSGGPVLDKSGFVVGINKSLTVSVNGVKTQGFTNATPMDQVKKLLEKWKQKHNLNF